MLGPVTHRVGSRIQLLVGADDPNLPLSITRSGTTTTYRYDGAGQRIAKQVGTGNTEVYVLDGATTLGVFTVNSGGTPTSWYFNLHAGDRVVGRLPNAGIRSYYHGDLLGSTRSVVQGTTVLESYDFEPWGLLMPGRTLGSGTKEGFTGKEQDTETGLDYFGARYYMPALGRWAAADPLAGRHPQWSPYSYALDNPVALIDPDGRQVAPNAGGFMGLSQSDMNKIYTLSPESRVRLSRGEMRLESSINVSYEMNLQKYVYPILDRIVVGAEAQFAPFPGLAIGYGVDHTSQGGLPQIEGHPYLAPGAGGGAGFSMGVRTSQARPGDVTGSLTLAGGFGIQVGYAASTQGERPRMTDVRLFVGFAVKGKVKTQPKLEPTVNIPNPQDVSPPMSTVVPADATAAPKPMPPKPTRRCWTRAGSAMSVGCGG